MPSAKEIHEHFLAGAPWVDPDETVDTFKAGDPLREVKTVAVGWMSTIYDLRKAVELGCELFITHEPTFWEHAAPEQRFRQAPGGIEKTRLLEETGLVVLRCHDAWDKWPGIGIRDAWAGGLGLTRAVDVSGDGWSTIYAMQETTLREFAAHVLSRVRPVGQDSVQVMGDPGMKISRPCLGVGCYSPGMEMIEKGADCLVGVFDGSWYYWEQRERFVECGAAVITVEHGCSEHWGMKNCADYVAGTWPGLTVHYLDLYPRPWTLK
ncbi:MAG: Nif3-like dinuclear metal center hexameric protein [Candidatus Glassbacteria bacterium]|nr:Nif3-like dinuclear metal center hexameric protein [Candidatus Glassbacteria bacterium]